jgi:hypothetical protein
VWLRLTQLLEGRRHGDHRRVPGAEPEMGIAGGAPGINASVEARDDRVVIVLTNLDPPTGTRLGSLLADALAR